MNEKKSGLTTAALILGIVSIVLLFIFNLGFIPGVVGLILSIVCLAKKLEPKGKGIAGLITSIAGIILSIIGGIVTAIVLIFVIPTVTAGFLTMAASSMASSPQTQQFIYDAIDELEDQSGSYTYNNSYDGDNFDWDFDTDVDTNFDFNDGGASSSSATTYSDKYAMTIGNTYFEDLTNYGYSYGWGDDTYTVYTKGYSEYEFPGYVFNQSDYGSTPEDAFLGFVNMTAMPQDGNYYTNFLTYYNEEWDYGYGEQMTHYDDENGNRYEYEIFLVALSKKTDDMVVMILRPDKDTIDDSFTDMMSLMDYMYAK